MFFSDPISILINAVIVAALAVVIVLLGRIKKQIRENGERLDVLYAGKRMARGLDKDANMQYVTSASIQAQDINKLRERYDEICVEFDTITQLVSIFPSLGILGTVIGLMCQVQAQGIDQMTDSIALALSSTCLALLITVAMKVYMAFSTSKELSSLEVKYRSYERERQDYVDKVKLSEE